MVDDGNLFVRTMEDLRSGDATARYLRKITSSAAVLSKRVEGVPGREHCPFVLGGDHSIAIGAVSGIWTHYRRKRKKPRPSLD